jgi:hypothetical protein
LLFRVGFPLRLVFAIFRSSLSLIELAMWRDAPLSDDLERLPRFAASAAPAAICCFFDFAGIQNNFAPDEHFGSISDFDTRRERVLFTVKGRPHKHLASAR